MTTTARPAPPRRRFGAPFEALAIEESALERDFEPNAFLYFMDQGPPPPPYRLEGDVAVVDVRGPLDTRAGFWADGYDAIEARVQLALADPRSRALVLAFDSPGGMCAGNLDTASNIRAILDRSTKPCVAHAGTMACSAAYALAAAADAIHVTTDGTVGSVGVIATVYDRTKANDTEGLNVKVVRSGPLKADPHPDVALTDASIARVRARVNDLAQAFGAYVAARRPKCADPLSLQGASVYGADAVSKGLADRVGTLADAISTAASMAATNAKRKNTMDATARLAAMREAAKVDSDDELVAHVGSLRTTAGRVPDLERQLAEAKAALATREKADAEKARADVLGKHRARGALTPAMESDAAFMGDLAPLTAEALDRILARLPGAPAAVAPRTTPPLDPKGQAPAASAETLTAEEEELVTKGLVSRASLIDQKRRDAASKQARGASQE